MNLKDLFYIYYMRILSHVLLLSILLFSCLSSEVIPFGEKAVNAIFKEKKEAVILFVDQND